MSDDSARMTAQQYYARIRTTIETHDQFVQYVFGGDEDPDTAFACTIGNTECSLPELLMIGRLEPRSVYDILNTLGSMMRKRERRLDRLVDLSGSYPVKTRRASPAALETYAIQAVRYYAPRPIELVQIVLPDPLGRYQGESGYDPA